MTHRASRSHRVTNPLLKARELQTSIHLVGGGEAADRAVPDGSQAITMRFPVRTAYRESPMAKPNMPNRVSLLYKLLATRCQPMVSFRRRVDAP